MRKKFKNKRKQMFDWFHDLHSSTLHGILRSSQSLRLTLHSLLRSSWSSRSTFHRFSRSSTDLHKSSSKSSWNWELTLSPSQPPYSPLTPQPCPMGLLLERSQMKWSTEVRSNSSTKKPPQIVKHRGEKIIKWFK